MSHTIEVTFREFDNMRERGHFVQDGQHIERMSHAGRTIIAVREPVQGKFPVYFTTERTPVWIEEKALLSVTMGDGIKL